MGCGVSKDCIADQSALIKGRSSSKASKKKLTLTAHHLHHDLICRSDAMNAHNPHLHPSSKNTSKHGGGSINISLKHHRSPPPPGPDHELLNLTEININSPHHHSNGHHHHPHQQQLEKESLPPPHSVIMVDVNDSNPLVIPSKIKESIVSLARDHGDGEEEEEEEEDHKDVENRPPSHQITAHYSPLPPIPDNQISTGLQYTLHHRNSPLCELPISSSPNSFLDTSTHSYPRNSPLSHLPLSSSLNSRTHSLNTTKNTIINHTPSQLTNPQQPTFSNQHPSHNNSTSMPLKDASQSLSPLHYNKVKLASSPKQAWMSEGLASNEQVESMHGEASLLIKGETYNVTMEKYLPPSCGTSYHDEVVGELDASNISINIDDLADCIEEYDPQQSTKEKIQHKSYDIDQIPHLTTWEEVSNNPSSAYLQELLEHFDKSTKQLHQPKTPRISWQSKLIETLDQDIEKMLLEDQMDVAALGKDSTSHNIKGV